MKKILFVGALFTSILLSSCSKDLLDVKFDTKIVEKITVDVAAGTIPLNQTVTLSLSNSEASKYLNKLKKIEVKKLSYKIIEFTGDSEGTINSSLEANDAVLHSITNVNVKNAFTAGTVYDVTNKDQLVNIASKLLADKSFTLESTGQTVSKSGMKFKIEVTLDLGVVANPL